MKKGLKAIGISLLYLLPYLGFQIVVIIIAAICAILSYMISAGGITTNLDQAIEKVYEMVMANTTLLLLIANVLSIFTYLLVIRTQKNKIRERLSLRIPQKSGLLAVIPLALSMNILISFILAFLPAEWFSSYSKSTEALMSGSAIITYLSVAVIAPIVEEMLFRGLIFDTLRKGLRFWPAILIQALIFAVMHGQLVWMAYAFIIGIVFAALRVRYNSLIPAIIAHSMFNLAGCISGQFMDYILTKVPVVYVGLLMLATLGVILSVYYILRNRPATEPEIPGVL